MTKNGRQQQDSRSNDQVANVCTDNAKNEACRRDSNPLKIRKGRDSLIHTVQRCMPFSNNIIFNKNEYILFAENG